MKYEEIINSIYSEPAAIITYKGDSLHLTDVNGKFISEMWVNTSKEEFLKIDQIKSFDEDNLSKFMNAVRKCIATGQEQTIDTWRYTASKCCGNEKVCIRSRFVLVEKNDDSAVLYEGIRNITDEAKMKDTFSDVEYRYQRTIEQNNIYNWEYDIETKEMRPCYRCMRDLGLPMLVENYPEPAIEAGIFPPDYADMYRDLMRQIDEGASGIEADIPLTTGRVPFRIKYTTEFDKNGKPIKAFGSATLISETELGNARLDNSIIESLAEEYCCIYVADLENDAVRVIKQDRVLSVNDNISCREMLSYLALKQEDKTKEQQQVFSDISRVRTELFKGYVHREFVYKNELDGSWIRVHYHVLEKSGDEVKRMLITVSVIDDLRAQNMESDRLIAAQKKELEERQKMLIAAVDEATRANVEKTRFFSSMSHDIRTPMNAITGFSRLALEEMDNRENLEDCLDKIVAAGDHLMNLINDVLDISKIESGKMELSPAPVKLKSLLTESAEMIRVKMDENNLKFNVDVEEMGEDVVECDRLRFNQVILNLLSNAYKFTPEGGNVTLTGRLMSKGERLTYDIRIKDTGIGMSKDFAERIWEPYSREDSRDDKKVGGTGLGMAIVKNIINLMHGAITLHTELDKGSEFVIELSLLPSSKDVNDLENKREAVLDKDYTGTTVLVVDDAPINRKLAERVLKKHGFTVIQADSGIKAIETVKGSKPGDIDIILMDVRMPVMDGLEATRKIRELKDPQLSGIPIIALTANAFASDVRETEEAGMNGHVPKPFKTEDLLSRIGENL